MDVGPTGNFPKNLVEFEERFGTEEACLEYFIALRWSDGFRCAGCGHDRAWRTTQPGMRCARCQREVAVLAGTMLEGTRKPLRWWFRAIWWVAAQKRGLSAKGFARENGIVELQDGVDLAAQVASLHGPSRPGSPQGSGGS